MWHGPHNGPMGTEIHGTRGLGRCRYGAKGNGTWDRKGGPKRQATARWDWETSRHGVVNHGPTMGSLATGSRENAPELRDGREVSAGVRVDHEVPGSMA